MAELGIDQSKLPGVKEVCRDFAVLEDHTLAHSLQEQEIEHHLATNVQRNRLVQYDLQMAKQLQEEEDRKARARLQERHKDIERQDCEIAQEIQVKLVIEAEQRRRQEEDDEDIARILQQKELQEEKRRKKPLPPEPVSSSPYKETYYPESRDRLCASPRDQAPERARPRRPRNGDGPHPGETRKGPPLLSEGLDLEVLGSSSEGRKTRGGRQRDEERREKKPEKARVPAPEVEDEGTDRGDGRTGERRRRRDPDSLERPRAASSLEGEADRTSGGDGGGRREGRPRSRERPQRPPALFTDREDEGTNSDRSNRHPKYRERQSPGSENSPRPLSLDAGRERRRSPYRHRGNSCSPNPDRNRLPPQEGRRSPRTPSRDPRHNGWEDPARRGRRRDAGGEYERAGERERPSSSSPRHRESREPDTGLPRNPGTKSKKENLYAKPRPVAAQDQELYDAEIARRLQEEELLANQVDTRAAQVAQDEEIARLLMAEEKKAYKKAREREKSSLEKRKQEPDWKHNTHEELHPRSREGHEAHRAKGDKPTRPPPPPTEVMDHLVSLTSQQNLAYPISKSEPSHKGYHYKQ